MDLKLICGCCTLSYEILVILFNFQSLLQWQISFLFLSGIALVQCWVIKGNSFDSLNSTDLTLWSPIIELMILTLISHFFIISLIMNHNINLFSLILILNTVIDKTDINYISILILYLQMYIKITKPFNKQWILWKPIPNINEDLYFNINISISQWKFHYNIKIVNYK